MEEVIFVFDMDGTLSLPGRRLDHIRGKKKNWELFYEGMLDDNQNEPLVLICKGLIRDRRDVRIVTGRPERYRDKTVEWLRREGMGNREIYMRKDGDHRPDYLVKAELIEPIAYRVSAIFEDRQQVVDMYRELGLTVCQVAKGDY